MQYLIDIVKWSYDNDIIPFFQALPGYVKWWYENGFIQSVQALLVFLGLWFTGSQLKQARRGFQATVVSQISERSSTLQWEIIKDPELQPLLSVPSATAEYKRALAVGLIVNHFALVYDLWKLGGIPDEVWDTFESDLRGTISLPNFKDRWQQLRDGHRPE